ncbi:HAD hydrolase family protein [Achromobacter sp. F4_2707]|uniref:KdsC family phosphatase n=1 Tax=Achromobacter sp. F4_2707 TaxID=3114286 RepID=UPI0039C60F7E
MNINNIPHPAEALILSKASAAVIERVRPLRLMAFDVDGVLTDGRLWYSAEGEQLKCFHVLDGHGLKMLMESGILVALITARDGAVIGRRAAELGIGLVQHGIRDKAQALQALAQEHNCNLSEVGYMGDDIIDVPAMQRAGFAASVANAPAYVAQAAHWQAPSAGGAGAVRDCCDLILAAQGKLGAFFSPNTLRPGGTIQ